MAGSLKGSIGLSSTMVKGLNYYQTCLRAKRCLVLVECMRRRVRSGYTCYECSEDVGRYARDAAIDLWSALETA
jgi:hypothetical protein